MAKRMTRRGGVWAAGSVVKRNFKKTEHTNRSYTIGTNTENY